MYRYQALVVALLIALIHSGSCYDTGHHNDLTRNALQLHGYSGQAQQIAGIGNFFVDYFAFQPDGAPESLPELYGMHFDNIFSVQNASLYWTQLVINSKKAIQLFVSNNDVLSYIMAVGGTLHTVQDFYTHSNWATLLERKSCGCFRNDTWISTMHEINGNLNDLSSELFSIFTYSYGENAGYQHNLYPGGIGHGDYCEGANKDSYDRPYFEQSYHFAFSGSMEWINNIHSWVNETDPSGSFLARAKIYVPPDQSTSDDLDKVVSLIRPLSYAVKFQGSDGHWKGAGSGSNVRFLSAFAEFSGHQSVFKDRYLKDKIHQEWVFPVLYDYQDALPLSGANFSSASGLVENTVSVINYSARIDYKQVTLRTVHVYGDKDDQTGTPSYYSRVNIDNFEFTDAVQINMVNFSPHWTDIKFVDNSKSTVDISYQLVIDRFPSSDPVVPINGDGSLTFTMDLASHELSGDVSDVHDTTETAYTTTDSGIGRVSIFVTTKETGNCPTRGLPVAYCPDGAYEYVGVHPVCYGSGDDTVPSSGNSVGVRMVVFGVLCVVLTFM